MTPSRPLTPEARGPGTSRRAAARQPAHRKSDQARQEEALAAPRPRGWRGFPTPRAIQLCVVAALAFGVYANTLINGFVNDDEHLILLNPWLESARSLPAIFAGTAWGFLPGRSIADYYRPLMHVLYLVTHGIFGFRAWGFHLVNVLLHIAVTALVFLLVARWNGMREPALARAETWLSVPFVAALLFAVHPIHTEAVAWIASIPELTFTPLCLLAFLFYLSPQGERPLRRALALTSFGLALLCKETALTLPGLLAIHNLALRPRRSTARELLARLWPYLAVEAAYLLLRYQVLAGRLVRSASSWDLSPGQLAATLPALFVKYLGLLIAPVHLAFWRPFHPVASLATGEGLAALAVTTAFAAAAWLAWRRDRLVFFALAAVVVPLAPVFYIDAFPRTPLAERYLYLPSIGFVLLVALALHRLATLARWRSAAFAALTALTMCYSAETFLRNRVWKDSYTLFQDSVAKAPDTARPPLSLASALMERGRADEALALYRILVEDQPALAEYRSAYGGALLQLGRTKEAGAELRKALELDPNSLAALNDLAITLRREGQLSEALALYRRALRIDASYPDAHFNLGGALADSGDVEGAIEHYREAVRLRPESAYYRSVLGIELAQRGEIAAALVHFEEAERLAPGEPAYRRNLEHARALTAGAAPPPQA
jgi:Flp pilus assembly protein TadD